MEKCPSLKLWPTPYWCFRFKVSGELPLMHIRVSDQKIRNILDLLNNIPLPSVGSASPTPADKVSLGGHRGELQETPSLAGCCSHGAPDVLVLCFSAGRCSCWLMDRPEFSAFIRCFLVPWKLVCAVHVHPSQGHKCCYCHEFGFGGLMGWLCTAVW